MMGVVCLLSVYASMCACMCVCSVLDLLSFFNFEVYVFLKFWSLNIQVFLLPFFFFLFFGDSNYTYVRPLDIIPQVSENPFISVFFYFICFFLVLFLWLWDHWPVPLQHKISFTEIFTLKIIILISGSSMSFYLFLWWLLYFLNIFIADSITHVAHFSSPPNPHPTPGLPHTIIYAHGLCLCL